MKKRTLIVLLGLFIIIIPILGLPPSWKNKIIMISGGAVALVAATKKRGTAMPIVTDVSDAIAEIAVSHDINSVPAAKKPKKPRTVKVSVTGKDIAEPSFEAPNEKVNS